MQATSGTDEVYVKQLCCKCQKKFNSYRAEAIQCQFLPLGSCLQVPASKFLSPVPALAGWTTRYNMK